MAPRYMSDRVEFLLILMVSLTFVISTASTKQCATKKTEGDFYVIRNIGIKLCQLKCAEHGQCVSIEYDIETLTCRVSTDGSKMEKEGHVIPASSHSHVPTGSCTSSTCGFGQRCLKTRSGEEVCVLASTTDACEELTPSNTVPPAPVTTQDPDAQATPSRADSNLYAASKDGDLERVKRILAAGQVNINARRGDYSRTPVIAAAKKGHWDVVEFLMGRGANVSVPDRFGNNVLHWACYSGDLEIVKLILSLNTVDINARDKYGQTAVGWARLYGHPEVLDFLVSHGAH